MPGIGAQEWAFLSSSQVLLVLGWHLENHEPPERSQGCRAGPSHVPGVPCCFQVVDSIRMVIYPVSLVLQPCFISHSVFLHLSTLKLVLTLMKLCGLRDSGRNVLILLGYGFFRNRFSVWVLHPVFFPERLQGCPATLFIWFMPGQLCPDHLFAPTHADIFSLTYSAPL